MRVEAIKTERVHPSSANLQNFLDKNLLAISENSILAITSKVLAICQGRVIAKDGVDKRQLIRTEADCFLPESDNRYSIFLTIKNGILIPSAGIDESNADGFYVLWPERMQESADDLRNYLIRRFHINCVGVVITDSTTSPLRSGVTGICLAHSGFLAVKDLVGHEDLFGRALKVTKTNVADGLAAAAVLVMGESNEQTPLAIISEAEFVSFQDRAPSKEELRVRRIAVQDDLYSQLLTSVNWSKYE